MMNDAHPLDHMIAEASAKSSAASEAERLAALPTPEQQLAERLAQAEFRERIAEAALMADVRPNAVRHVVRDAESVFELRDGALVPRNDAKNPSDPLEALTPARWLQELRKTDGYLFALQGRAH